MDSVMTDLKPTGEFDSYIDEMKWRGFFEQCTDEDKLTEVMATSNVTAYCGFDPTADSLHIGSLTPIMGTGDERRVGKQAVKQLRRRAEC